MLQGLLVALAALAVSLCFAVARFPNAATGDFMTLAAYVGVGLQAVTGSLVVGVTAAILAVALISLGSYALVFRPLIRSRSLVAPLIASIGLAFLLRSVLTFFVGFDQLSFRIPIARALVFGGVRIRPSDLWLLAIALATLLGVLAVLFLTRPAAACVRSPTTPSWPGPAGSARHR